MFYLNLIHVTIKFMYQTHVSASEIQHLSLCVVFPADILFYPVIKEVTVWINKKLEVSSENFERNKVSLRNSLPNNSISPPERFPVGKPEFPIVKDTTPNMMNPRLYTTSYNKPQGQQFDDTAVLSFIKLQYT